MENIKEITQDTALNDARFGAKRISAIAGAKSFALWASIGVVGSFTWEKIFSQTPFDSETAISCSERQVKTSTSIVIDLFDTSCCEKCFILFS